MSLFITLSCDAAVAKTVTSRSQATHPKLVLATTILASSLAFVDGSVVNVGLPAIGASFGAEADTLQWVINAYLLPVSALLLLGGAAGDRFGRRLMLISGIAIFALASALCAIASSPLSLLSGRAAQGIGAALLLPNSLAILGDAFTGEERGRAIGTWAAMGAVVGAVGPVLGGWLIDNVGWRAIFLLNLPLAIAAIVLALLFVQDVQNDTKRLPLDAVGGFLATVGLGALTWGLTVGAGRAGWTDEAVVVVVAGGALILAFIWFEGARGTRAMMPLTLFGSRTFVGLTLLTFFLYGALGGLLVLLPYVLITEAHYSATAAGAALLPFPLVIALASPLMGGLAARIGPRWPLTVGPRERRPVDGGAQQLGAVQGGQPDPFGELQVVADHHRDPSRPAAEWRASSLCAVRDRRWTSTSRQTGPEGVFRTSTILAPPRRPKAIWLSRLRSAHSPSASPTRSEEVRDRTAPLRRPSVCA
jgi:MFS family permease